VACVQTVFSDAFLVKNKLTYQLVFFNHRNFEKRVISALK